nr:immunoglobulin light chain junction region [Macaca mulatta]MOW02672.1 immunoglobulin light chain junction region [Macaca mulatta]MOW03297.1 immunoglobulin light chain junction region [Macaca mulatta]
DYYCQVCDSTSNLYIF